MTKKSALLDRVFSSAVDGANANAYRIILQEIRATQRAAKLVSFTLKDIESALKPLSARWDKQITKYVDC